MDLIIGIDAKCDNCFYKDTNKCIRGIDSKIGCSLWKGYVVKEKPCLCNYPCKNENCPKGSKEMCHTNYCNILAEYSRLTYKNNYCPICGRKLKS